MGRGISRFTGLPTRLLTTVCSRNRAARLGGGAIAPVMVGLALLGCQLDSKPRAAIDAAVARDARPRLDAARATDSGIDAAPSTIRVAVISDLNGSYGSTSYGSAVHSAVGRLIELAPDVVLSTGDMVAGQQAGLDYPAMWAGFHAAVSDPLAAASIPLAVTPGNHDASGYAAYAGERAEYVAQWSPRKPGVQFLDDSDYPLRYSFAVGQVLFLALDDTTVGKLDTGQMSWIEQQLSTHASYPVKVVFGHLPLYPFAQGRETEIIGDPALETMLVDGGVDLFVSGHHHAYYPGQRGPLRLVSMACLGAGPRVLVGDDQTSARSILLFEVTGAAIRALDAYGGGGFDELIDRQSLPSSVGTGEQLISRDDTL